MSSCRTRAWWTALLALLVGLLVWLSATPAHAFHPADTFVRTANRGGGSNIFYTGSQRFRGYNCTMCHQAGPGNLQLVVTADPAEILDGLYKPLEVYTITVEMTGEIIPPEGETNFNLFVAEFVDDAGKPVGRFDEQELSTLQRVSGDVNVNGAIFGANDRTRWIFTYTAPAADTGRISFHAAGVTGDSGMSQPEPRAPSDPFGDDVFVMSSRACEQFSPCDTSFAAPQETTSPVGHGCSISSGQGVRGQGSRVRWLWVLLALAIAMIRLRPSVDGSQRLGCDFRQVWRDAAEGMSEVALLVEVEGLELDAEAGVGLHVANATEEGEDAHGECWDGEA